ncbi:uncharacterized protein LOC103153700 [Poecilia formosa]|uniref:uncharacterized protein LOC103153700 n=1 Tax=Poecilia formosa TaxID=48698 RepID=UPI0007BAC0E6|nr:PREDICTED: uncharacterized protein LOC103153700 [Poecilia formosa]XP_016517598.1 PREDICTED: uncharacterized protein LOC103153700 [Poecilia formosa]XP_016517599.1 PREDICTED: uncharacterized protein LOC103153700 [Poecilia formosa]XP_016517600.1 PREDICTED: uncharacterized protein LOC103153700 [Poecilia formosa]XP_016517601.1 PREDICTED: uncharacterized protein LOC103153700 [Poecilia formosa]
MVGIYDLLKLGDKMEKLISERDQSKHSTQEELKERHAEKAAEQKELKKRLDEKAAEQEELKKRLDEKAAEQEELKKRLEKLDQSDDSAKGGGVKCFQCKSNDKCKTCTEIEKDLNSKGNKKPDSWKDLKATMDPKNILKICEEYFGESLPSHVINITQQGDVASDLYYLREEEIFDRLPVQTSTDTFSFSELDDNEGRKWLESLLRTDMKDADIPEIDAELLKSSAGSISGPIRHILNLCLMKCEFPSELNQFEFIPFSTKKLTKFRENSLRLHSLHVMIGYILDIILYKQAEKYFIYKRLIPSKSVDDQIKNLKTVWPKATKSGKCWFLDFSSSFDSISHVWLLTKLEESGFLASALKLIKSFLSYHEGSCGLPRGSFLARLLFTVFISELKGLVSPSSADICQNHMIVYTTHENPKMSEKQLEAKIQSVKEWAKIKGSRFKEKRHNLDKELDINVLFKLLLELVNKLKLNWIQVLTEILMSQLAFKRKAVPVE